MQVPLTSELQSISQSIVDENLSLAGWAEIESDDMFQTARTVGGFDAVEGAFLFSWVAVDESEYWFELSIEEVARLATEESIEIPGIPAQR